MKLKKVILVLAAVMMFFAVNAFASKVDITENGYFENFDSYAGSDSLPKGFALVTPGVNYTSTPTLTSVTGKSGKALQFNAAGQFSVRAPMFFSEAYTKGGLTVHFDFMIPEGLTTYSGSIDIGLLESRESSGNGSLYDAVESAGVSWQVFVDSDDLDKIFTLYPEDSNKYYIQYLFNGDAGNENLRRGSLVQAEKPLECGRWYTVDCIIDLAKRTVSTYIDGEPLYEKLTVGGGRKNYGVEGLCLNHNPRRSTVAADKSIVSIDNLILRHSANYKDYAGVAVTPDNSVKLVNPQIKLTFLESVFGEISSEKIKAVNTLTGQTHSVNVTNVSLPDVDIEIDGELDYYSDYELQFDESIQGVGGRKAKPAKFRTDFSMGGVKYLVKDDFESYISDEEHGYALPEKFNKFIGADEAFVSDDSSLILKQNADTENYIYAMFDDTMNDFDRDTALTFEFDIEAPNGGFFLNLLTSKSLTEYTEYALSKKIFALASTNEQEANVKRSGHQIDDGLKNAATNQSGSKVISFGSLNEKKHVVLEFYPMPGGSSRCVYTIVDYEPQTDKWINFRKSDIYDGEILTDIAGFGMGMLKGSGEGCRINNLAVYRGTKAKPESVVIPVLAGAVITDYNGAELNSYDNITPFVKSLSLGFPCEMQEDVGEYIVFDGNADCTGRLSDDSKTYVFEFPNGLRAADSYSVKMAPGALSKDGVAVERSAEINISTADEHGIVFSDIVMTAAGKRITDVPRSGTECRLNASVFNNTENDCEYYAAVCMYSEHDGFRKMEAINIAPAQILKENGGAADIDISITIPEETTAIACYLIDFRTGDIIAKSVYGN